MSDAASRGAPPGSQATTHAAEIKTPRKDNDAATLPSFSDADRKPRHYRLEAVAC